MSKNIPYSNAFNSLIINLVLNILRAYCDISHMVSTKLFKGKSVSSSFSVSESNTPHVCPSVLVLLSEVVDCLVLLHCHPANKVVVAIVVGGQ